MAKGLDSEELKARVRREFDLAASTYDGVRAMRNASIPLLTAAALKPGQRVLDIATGTGFIALPAAREVMPDGSVMAIDLAPEMVAQTRRNAAAAGLTNLTCAVGDAEALDFADESFDVVICGLGIFFLPNQAQAVLEWRRVLKPGGWLHFSAWGAGMAEPLRGFLNEVLTRYGLTPQTVASPLPQPDACKRALEEANFTAVTVTTEQVGFHYRDADEYWAELTAGPGATGIKSLSADKAAQLKADLLTMVASVGTAEGIFRRSPLHIASGRNA